MNHPSTRLAKLELKNFRCFSELAVSFHEKLTVIVAPNGGGKTALLDAISLGWHHFLKGMDWDNAIKGIPAGDDRVAPSPNGDMLVRKPVIVAGQNIIDDKVVQWRIDKGVRSLQNTSSRKALPMWSAGYELRKQLQDYADSKLPTPPVLPVVGFYGTGRLWSAKKVTESVRKKIKADTSAPSGYHLCLSPSSHFELFEIWYERMARAAQDERETKVPSAHHPTDRLKVVTGAVDRLLKPTGWGALAFDFGVGALTATHPSHGKLPVSSLSDGIRIMIGLVGDIAHRCARLNHHFHADAAMFTPGVIMIDEVDMHLHPEWQQLVLKALQDAFPLIQFIVTTHSPQVLTTVKRENIRILAQDTSGVWTADEPKEQTKGVESAAALAGVMDVDPIPPVQEARDLSRYKQLIQLRQHDSEEGLKLRAILDGHFGPRHPLILDCDRLIRFEQFKARLPAKPSQPAE